MFSALHQDLLHFYIVALKSTIAIMSQQFTVLLAYFAHKMVEVRHENETSIWGCYSYTKVNARLCEKFVICGKMCETVAEKLQNLMI